MNINVKGSCFTALFLLLFSSCKDTVKLSSNSDNSSTRKIIVERGAIHYDQFVLKDSVVTFIPTESGMIEEFPQYTVSSKTNLSNEVVGELFQEIENQGFFKLNNEYGNNFTDNSMLRVTVESGDKKKTVFSEDFDRGCPEVLKFIENEIVRLHGKNLKRHILPG